MLLRTWCLRCRFVDVCGCCLLDKIPQVLSLRAKLEGVSVDHLRDALYAPKLASYAQGFQMLSRASAARGYARAPPRRIERLRSARPGRGLRDLREPLNHSLEPLEVAEAWSRVEVSLDAVKQVAAVANSLTARDDLDDVECAATAAGGPRGASPVFGAPGRTDRA